jgi:hypothetical protein
MTMTTSTSGTMTTERPVLPGGAGTGAGGDARRPAATARAPRAGTGPRRPVHLAVLTGAAAGAYAISLAGVTALQATTDAGLAVARDPLVAAIADQQASHDRLERVVEEAAAAYAEVAGSYAAVLEVLGDHEGALAVLEREIAAAEGSAASLVVPARPALPTIRATAATRAVPRPRTNASTGASGGG